MKWVAVAVVLAGVAAPGAAAQNPPPRPPGDSLQPAPEPMGPMQDPMDPRAQQLRLQVEERFGRMVQADLQLDEQQMQRLRQAMRANQDRRRDLNRREMDIQREIMRELRPGEAADDARLNRLLAEQAQLRTQRAQSDEQFVRDLEFMPPPKRARFLLMARRFEMRMQDIIRERQGRGGMQPGRPDRPVQPGRPGMAPGARPGAPDRPARPGTGRPQQRPARPRQ